MVICTVGRKESLLRTLKSLEDQTFKNFEVVLVTTTGSLAHARNLGMKSAIGKILTFIDDDVWCPSTYLKSVVKEFNNPEVVGVSGPTLIESIYRSNRDLFKWSLAKKLHDWLFVKEARYWPGTLSECGTPSMSSNEPWCLYEGPVNYLEACNMSVRRSEALLTEGFDEGYVQTSEWSEPDFCFALSELGKLRFSQSCKLYHCPSKEGIYRNRLNTTHRWENFKKFQNRHGFHSLLYRGFVWAYFKLKQIVG